MKTSSNNMTTNNFDAKKTLAKIYLPLLFCLFNPFWFSTISGIRVILLIAPLFLLIILNYGFEINKRQDLLFFILFCFFVFFISAYSNLDVFSALLFFFILLYWPDFLPNQTKQFINKRALLNIYIYTSVVVAMGVLLQRYLFFNSGVVVGKIDMMYQRTGFALFWKDYSFLSLYLVSVIPLIKKLEFKNYFNIPLMLLLFSGSMATSARTGFFSLVAFYGIIVIFRLLLIFKNRIDINLATSLFGFILILFLSILLLPSFTDRTLDFDSSGRLDGYLRALEYFSNNFFLGACFNIDAYKEAAGTLPHNLLLYLLTMGGIVCFLLFSFWLLLFINRIKKYLHTEFGGFLAINFIGLQFIPSPFSAYYFALGMSFIILYTDTD